MNWFTNHRQQWICETLRVFGFINREHICRKFGVSVPQASMDMREFMKANPGLARYDLQAKRFITNERMEQHERR